MDVLRVNRCGRTNKEGENDSHGFSGKDKGS
jgi:hypothetical protein